MLSHLKKLLSLLDAREKRDAAILFGMMLIGAMLEVVGVAAIPAFVSVVIDPDGLRGYPVVGGLIDRAGLDSTGLIVWGSIALVAVFAVKNGFLMLNYWAQVRYVAEQRVSLSRRLTQAYLSAPYEFHLGRNSAVIIRNVNREVMVIATSVMAPLLELCTRLLILAFVLIFLFVLEPVVTLFWIAFLTALGAVGVLGLSGKLQRYGLMEQMEGRQVVQGLNQAFHGIKDVKVAGREIFFADKIANAVRTMAETSRFKGFVSKAMTPVLEFAAVVGLLGLATWLVLSGRPTESIIVTLSLFVVGLVRLRETLTAATAHLSNLRYSMVSVDPVWEDLQRLDSTRRPALSGRGTPQPVERRIELRDVWHRYDEDSDYALKGVNVEIEKGTAVGFVGSTGAGKSTLVDTILALLEPEKGGVFVDGTDIRDSGIRGWQASIGYVPQSIYLLDDTIRRNIAFGVPDDEIDEQALARAISTAQLQHFVDNQPRKLDTHVGERGGRLSGGERQRIGIARALYHDPEVLIFDEATSALDNTTERAIVAAVERLKGKRTILMIAHRLTTVRKCDVLHFIKDGRIEASGSYDQLKADHAEFRLMTAG